VVNFLELTTNKHEYIATTDFADYTDFLATEHIRLRQGFGGTGRGHRGFFVSTAIYDCPESKPAALLTSELAVGIPFLDFWLRLVLKQKKLHSIF
jgi:hypothetical protein